MDTLWSDIRFAIRSLVRAPTFAVTAVCALALGIRATAAVFSLLQAVVLRPLPFKEPNQLVSIWDTNREKSLTREGLPPVCARGRDARLSRAGTKGISRRPGGSTSG